MVELGGRSRNPRLVIAVLFALVGCDGAAGGADSGRDSSVDANVIDSMHDVAELVDGDTGASADGDVIDGGNTPDSGHELRCPDPCATIVELTAERAVVEFTFSRNGPARIVFGTDESFGQSSREQLSSDFGSAASPHRQVLNGLSPNTGYFYRVETLSAPDNWVPLSPTLQFETPESTDVPEGYRLVHRSSDGTFGDRGVVARGIFHGREAAYVTHTAVEPSNIIVYNRIGDGPRNGVEGGGARAGLLRVKIYCEENACWNDGGGKILGMYGGNGAGGSTVAGVQTTHGCPSRDTLSLDGGWSQRLTTNRTRGEVAMYTYEQNRCLHSPGTSADGAVFGANRRLDPGLTLPEGRWVQVEMEVTMNDEGEANGTGSIVVEASSFTRDGILWQSRSREFGVVGFLLSLQWQGATVRVGSSIGFSDFEFYVQDW
jgi:hypothetical protein